MREGKAHKKITPAVIADLYTILRDCTTIVECKEKITKVQEAADVSNAALRAILVVKNHLTVSCAHWTEDMWTIYQHNVFDCAKYGTYTHHKVCTCQKRGRQSHIMKDNFFVFYPELVTILNMLMHTSAQETAAKGVKSAAPDS